jgi:hypothetical protein
MLGWGNLVPLSYTGAADHRRSNAIKKNVFFNFGIGPPNDAPVSLRLKYG